MSAPKIRYRKCNQCLRTELHEDSLVKLLKLATKKADRKNEYCFWCRLKTLKNDLLLISLIYPLCIFLILHSEFSGLTVLLYISLYVHQIKLLDAYCALFFGTKTTTFHLIR
jgi:hypothetical protein